MRGFDVEKVGVLGRDIYFCKQKNYNSNLTNINEDLVKNELSKLPPEMVDLVKQINFYDSFNMHDFHWEEEYNTPNFKSDATGGQGEINFYGESMYYDRLIPHEIGHTYDTVYASTWDPSISKISTSQIWLNAIKADKAASGCESVTEYGKVSPVEDFAESVSLFYKDPKALDKFPNRKKLLEEHLPKVDYNTFGIQKSVNYNPLLSLKYDSVMNELIERYGYEKAYEYMDSYVNGGLVNNMVFDKEMLSYLSDFSKSELSYYHKNLQISKSLNYALDTMIKTYGTEYAIDNFNSFLKTGNDIFITRNGDARIQMQQYSIYDIQQYVYEVNNNSLDIRNLADYSITNKMLF